MEEVNGYVAVCAIAVVLFLGLFLLMARLRMFMLRKDTESKYLSFGEHFNFCTWNSIRQQIDGDKNFFANLMSESYGRDSQDYSEAIQRASLSQAHLNQETKWALDHLPLERRLVMLDILSCDESLKEELRADYAAWQKALEQQSPLVSGSQKVVGLIGLILLSVVLVVPPWEKVHDSSFGFTGRSVTVHQRQFAGFRPLHFREATQYGKTSYRRSSLPTQQRLRSKIAFVILYIELLVFMLGFSLVVLSLRSNTDDVRKLVFSMKARRAALSG